MKNPFQKRTSISAIEAETANLAKRQVEVTQTIADTQAALHSARLERRETLSGGGDLEGLTARIRSLAIQLEDLENLKDDIAAQAEDAAGRLSKVRDDDARVATALALEQIAAAAELRGPEIEKAAATLAKAVEGLRADLGEDLALWHVQNANRPEGSIDASSMNASAREIAAAILADALAKAMPWAFDTFLAGTGYRSSLSRMMDPEKAWRNWSSESPTDPKASAAIISALVSAPLRERASQIRAGEPVAAKLAPSASFTTAPVPAAPPNILVFVLKSFSYLTDAGVLALVAEGWVKSVPEPVAAAAEAEDIAVRISTPRGKKLFDEAQEQSRKRRSSSTPLVTPSKCIALGDVLSLRPSPDEAKSRAKA